MPYQIDENLKFVNPYNFVPLGKSPDRQPVEQWRGRNTGRISCTLTIKTPLAYPDTRKRTGEQLSGDKDDVPYTYPFFRIGEKPAILGSELRGALRSVFEAATNSCMSVLDADIPLTGRSRVIKQEGGLLHFKGKKWKIRPTKVYTVNTFSSDRQPYFEIQTEKDKGVPEIQTEKDKGVPEIQTEKDKGVPYIEVNGQKYHSGDEVAFTVFSGHGQATNKISRLGTGGKKGILLIGERGLNTNRVNSHVFETPKNHATEVPVPETAVEKLREVLKDYGDRKVNLCETACHSGYKGYRIPEKDTEYLPVFYDMAGSDHFYLSPAMISRESYYTTLKDLAKYYLPCTGEFGRTCPACGVFGMAGKAHSYGSAIRVSDAIAQEGYRSSYVTLQELSSPKITSGEFYTFFNKQDARSWTVDYYTDNTGKHPLSSGKVQMRGRKFYLHHPNFCLDNATTTVKTNRNATMEVLECGSFTFDVYFDDISDDMLAALKWCLQPTDQEGKRLWHKTGHGRPLGLGSVEIAINAIESRKYSDGAYTVATETVIDTKGFDVPEQLRRVMDPELVQEDALVHYPIGDDGTDGPNSRAAHQWFTANRQINGTGLDPAIAYILPPIGCSDLRLPAMQASPAQSPATGNRSLQDDPGKYGYIAQRMEKYKVKAVVVGTDKKGLQVRIEGDSEQSRTISCDNAEEYPVGSELTLECVWYPEEDRYGFTIVEAETQQGNTDGQPGAAALPGEDA